VAHDTGGIHDTVRHLNVEAGTGNGFVFKTFDASGLFWAIEEAMRFYSLPAQARARQIKRIMTEAVETFTYEQSARQYIQLYEKMLQRQLVVD
jgi:starch synthase/alpha-amylase